MTTSLDKPLFKRGDKVWVLYASVWHRGRVVAVAGDGAPLVRISGLGIHTRNPETQLVRR